MTAPTRLDRAFELLGGMAKRAIDLGMPPVEQEVGAVVIKASLPPRALRVTLRTIFSELRLVDIVIGVAGSTSIGRIAALSVRRMTAPALHPPVCSDQWIVGRSVIECFNIEPDDVRLSSHVLAVASATHANHGRWLRSMETAARPQIRCDIIVALETESSFGSALEGTVTASALRFDIGVPLDHRAGGHERFEVDGRTRSRKREHDCTQQEGRQENDSAHHDSAHPWLRISTC